MNFPNTATVDAFVKCKSVFETHNKILLSYSGGSDSDTMLDLVQKVLKDLDWKGEIKYVWFDTGIEYDATKRHIPDIEKKYDITIERVRAKVPVPLGCKKFGLPFLSKDISSKINVLQNHNFDFKKDGNKSFAELINKYDKCSSVIKWWCNEKTKGFGINANLFLKEFMIENPPTFKISSMCCWGAKKSTSHEYEKNFDFDLKVMGLRGAEGGVRATKIKNCFSHEEDKIDIYRPIWWFSDKDKQEYKDFYELKFSDCYEVYGFKRTGCCGCPFNSKFEEDLDKIKDTEPMLFKAVNNIFGASYEYTRAYRKFKEQKKKQKEIQKLYGLVENQTSIFDEE